MGTLRTHTAYGGDTVLPAVAHELLAATSIALHHVPFLPINHDAVYATSAQPNGTVGFAWAVQLWSWQHSVGRSFSSPWQAQSEATRIPEKPGAHYRCD